MDSDCMNATAPALDTWDYQTDKVLIVPYVPKSNENSLPEEFLASLYAITKKDDLFRRAFPAGPKFNLNSFIGYFYNRTMLIGIIKPGAVAGYTWIYDIEGNEKFKKGSVGVCFFREFWGRQEIVDLARLGLYWYFEELHLKAIFGTIAKWNRSSLRFAKLLGFEECGCIPFFFLSGDTPTASSVVVLEEESMAREAGF
jgi:RimJ/RimL family protein N-acetyltransferase